MRLADPDTTYSEDYDGVITSGTWKTKHARKTTGCTERYPVILYYRDRVMID